MRARALAPAAMSIRLRVRRGLRRWMAVTESPRAVCVSLLSDHHASRAAAIVKDAERVPDIPMLRSNAAAFIHERADGHISDIDGAGDHGHTNEEIVAAARAEIGRLSAS